MNASFLIWKLNHQTFLTSPPLRRHRLSLNLSTRTMKQTLQTKRQKNKKIHEQMMNKRKLLSTVSALYFCDVLVLPMASGTKLFQYLFVEQVGTINLCIFTPVFNFKSESHCLKWSQRSSVSIGCTGKELWLSASWIIIQLYFFSTLVHLVYSFCELCFFIWLMTPFLWIDPHHFFRAGTFSSPLLHHDTFSPPQK